MRPSHIAAMFAVCLAAAFAGVAWIRAADDVIVDQATDIPAGGFYSRVLEFRDAPWHRLDVQSLEGSVHVAFKRVLDPTGPTARETLWLTQAALPVPAGRTQSTMGRIDSGYWVLLVFNASDGKPARARIRLALQRE